MLTATVLHALRQVCWWLGLPLLVTALGFLPGALVAQSTLLLLYLCAVLITALHCGRPAVIFCAVLAFLLFNFFHAEPYFTLYFNSPSELLAAAVFVGFGILAGGVAGKLNRQLGQLQMQTAFFAAQVQLHRRLQEIAGEAAIPPLLDVLFGPVFRGQLRFGLQQGGAMPLLEWKLAPGAVLTQAHDTMLASLREQVQSELQRLATARALQQAQRESDEEKLRSALLSSVSHDLKTPLVTMLGAATSLRDLRQDLSSSDAEELLDCIISESQRLEAYIQNLLDMTRLGHGTLALSRDWVSIEEIYHVVARRFARHAAVPPLELQVAGELPALYVHAALIEQALFNVIDNAVKAAGTARAILVMADVQEDMLRIRICDHGPGLPHSEWKAVFDPFHTFSLGDCYEKGTGLGLSICRSILRVHGGDAEISEPPPGFGHCVSLRLPLPAATVQEAMP